MFLPSSNTTCSLPELPVGRAGHTQDGGLACGGLNSPSNQYGCVKWWAGNWTWTSHFFRKKRYYHVSWSTAQGLYLIGGYSRSVTTSDLVKEDGSVEKGFDLKYDTS